MGSLQLVAGESHGLAVQHLHDLLAAGGGAANDGILGSSAHMGGEHHVLHGQEGMIQGQGLLLEHVQSGAVDLALFQSADQGTNIQTPAQMAKYHQFSGCINCGLCYAACPQFGLNPEFIGPAAITLAHRYNEDSRDHGKKERMAQLNSQNGVWSCTFVGYCSEVCPKHVDPAAAIQQGKVESSKDFLIATLKPR